MTDHLLAVVVCWLVALCGLGMWNHATSWRGRIGAHGAVAAALLALSIMALDHQHDDKPRYAMYLGATGEVAYHAPGCPLAIRDVIFRTPQEAAWANKIPCTHCLGHEAKEQIERGAE